MKRISAALLLLALGACAAPQAPYRAIPSWQGTTFPGGNYPASYLAEGGMPDKGSSGDGPAQ
jgi:hypothetical protein